MKTNTEKPTTMEEWSDFFEEELRNSLGCSEKVKREVLSKISKKLPSL